MHFLEIVVLISFVFCHTVAPENSLTTKENYNSSSFKAVLEKTGKGKETNTMKGNFFPYLANLKNKGLSDCQTVTFISRVSKKGCKPKLIAKGYCLGYCKSVTLPDSGLCEICKPTEVVEKEVELDCPRLVDPKLKKKVKYYMIKGCSCERIQC